MDEDLEELVDSVLAACSKPLRELCDRTGILNGLGRAGIFTLETLRTMLQVDYIEVKAAVLSAAKPSFVAILKDWPL